MDVLLIREYHPKGTNGGIYVNGRLICYAIELPWLDNRTNVSCIPEGRYLLGKRHSQRWQWHVVVQQVRERSHILFHPANYALKELRGCIAPVTSLTGTGSGTQSARACRKLQNLVFAALGDGEDVFLHVCSLRL